MGEEGQATEEDRYQSKKDGTVGEVGQTWWQSEKDEQQSRNTQNFFHTHFSSKYPCQRLPVEPGMRFIVVILVMGKEDSKSAGGKGDRSIAMQAKALCLIS